MTPLKITVKAREDLIGIARFTEQQWGRERRWLYLKQMDDSFHALANTPSLGRDCANIKSGYWKYTQGSHVIFYRLGSDACIEIVRVLHKRMDLARHL